MKTRFLIERLKDSLSSVFKTSKGELKKKPLLIVLGSTFVLVAGILFFAFNGSKTPLQNAMLQNAANPRAAAGETPSGQAGQSPQAEQKNRNLSLAIVPGQAYAGTVLHLSAGGFNLSDAQIEWMVNGMARVPDSPIEFDTKDLSKGDVVQADAGINGMEVKSNSVTLGDAPLTLESVRLMPEVFKPGENLYVDASMAGGGTKNIAYEWTVNGKFAGNSNSLGMPVKRGDDVSVKVTPCGAPVYQYENGCGQPVVLQRRIENMPPMFSRHVSTTFDGTLYTAQLSATDPDGDPITYSLEGAPDGMKIDASSGLIQWKAPQEVFLKGVQVTAVASDGHGGTSRMTLNISPK
ncbi:MAG: cadherin repeat domain-containing protein [Nitrospiraceae bacterium]|nr:cadherin repeat domain-containing protein [Nitrospiraceae bacterium]